MLKLTAAGPLTSAKLATKFRSPTSPTATNEQATQQNGSASYADGRRESEAVIDPLSQVCTYPAVVLRQTWAD